MHIYIYMYTCIYVYIYIPLSIYPSRVKGYPEFFREMNLILRGRTVAEG